ncbi:kinase-like domain-containing protein [Lasiosphaeria hispida]|uniref:non-specific serine/threonine protein kinase n=1 Tax=Lasiosphaeria hispida TaxID=260671 RepID=A0AAJ0HFS3_9PEZI|nr:kinase-like domain-containing protein [Lasiosphaeria hispida]
MSFHSEGSHSSQALVPISEYLEAQDHENFVWDRAGEEIDDAWVRPVLEAGLDPRKHKVLHHASKEYTNQPQPFQYEDHLGESGSTIVYRVRAPKGYTYHRPMALKVIVCKESLRPPGPNSNARKLALQEVRNMSAIRHPHIVVYVASFEDYCIRTRELEVSRPRHGRPREVVHRNDQIIKKHILGIAMYPPAPCNLQMFMQQCIPYPTNDSDWWKVPYMHTYFGCLAQAVAYLHKSNVRIRHKDIKPENVVIDHFGLPVLTDFGLSKHFETGHHSDGPTAKTLKYADPEAMHETTRDERSDIFSLGCVYLEMATVLLGRLPRFAEDQLGRGHRNEDFKYSESLQGLDQYLSELAHIADEETAKTAPDDRMRLGSLKAIVSVLPTIGQMMHGDFAKRPYAQDLYPLFRHLYDVPGCQSCNTCEEERMTGRFTPKSGSQRSSSQRSGSPTMIRSPTLSSLVAANRRNSLLVVAEVGQAAEGGA